MKTNREKILIAILLLLIAGVVLVFGFNKLQLSSRIQKAAPLNEQGPDYAEGEIVVVFKHETSEQQALALLKKHQVTPLHPQEFYRYSSALFNSSSNNVDSFVEQIRHLPYVSAVHGANKGEQGVKVSSISVDFSPGVKDKEINEILSISPTLTIDTQLVFGRMEIIEVPKGSEKELVTKFQTEPEVKSAFVNMIMRAF